MDKNFSIINGMEIIVPSEFEWILPVSPSTSSFYYEPYAFLGMKSCMDCFEGGIAFDIGASYGVMSTLLAKMASNVHSFEANPQIIDKIELLFQVNDIKEKVIFNNKFVGDISDKEQDFLIIEGFRSPASTADSNILSEEALKNIVCSKKIKTISLDDYCAQNNIIPDFIKIDIEGSEYIAFKGFKKTITKYLPDLQIETHATQIDRIGGSLLVLLKELESFGYELYDLQLGCMTSADEYHRLHNNNASYVLASVNLTKRMLPILNDSYKILMTKLQEKERYNFGIITARNYVNMGVFNLAKPTLKELIKSSEKDGEADYLLGISILSTAQNAYEKEEAKAYLNKALEYGCSSYYAERALSKLKIL